MNKKSFFPLAALAIFAGCATGPKAAANRNGSLELPGFTVRSGGHCESSAMLNALSYLGYGLCEADIVGGGGAPAFVLTAGSFPFLGGRNEGMREVFLEAAKIPYKVLRPTKGEDGWAEIFSLLADGLPVLLRVDMRYLPYLYGGKYGSPYMSFGGHWLCLYAIDFDARTALVTDTEHDSGQRVSLADLDKARFSATKSFPPQGEFAWIERKPEAWRFDPDRQTRAALAEILKNYGEAGGRQGAKERPLVGLAGLAAFPEVLAGARDWANPYALAPAYGYLAGSIERNGTGGQAFRRLFRDFLAARASDCADPGLRRACASLIAPTERAMAAWRDLAAALDEAARTLAAAKGGAKAGQALSLAEAETSAKARAVYAAEAALRDAIAGL